MKYIKTYEGVFFSRKLVDSIFNLLNKYFDIEYQFNKTWIKFNKGQTVFLYDFISFDKQKDYIKIGFISDSINSDDFILAKNDIIEKISKISKIKRNNHYIKIPISDYDKVVKLFENYPTKKLDRIKKAKKYNIL